MSDVINGVSRELLEFIAANARGVEREKMDKLRALLSEQPQPECGEVLEVRGLQWLDTGHYRKKPPQFGYNPHDWNELCLVADAQRQIAEHKRLLAERGDVIKEWSALAIQRGEERDILQKKLDRFYSQSHGIPALTEIEKLRARVAELEKMLGACLTYATRMEPMSAKLMNAIDAALTQLSGRKEEEHEKA